MVAKDLDLIHAVFGTDLDAVVVDATADKEGAKCQAAVAKAIEKCRATKFKEYNACKKKKLQGKGTAPARNAGDLQDECMGTGRNGIPDVQGKIQRSCNTKLTATLSKKCGVSNLDALVPSCAPGVSQTCLDQKVECEVCKALNALDGLSRNCDEFDDGVANGSCP